MSQTYGPFDAGAGANFTEAMWTKLVKHFFPTGVFKGDLNELAVSTNESGLDVQVATGRANIQGHLFESDAIETLTPAANASGSTRIDRVIIRADFTANTIALAILQGTAGAGAPALTQSSTTWETPLAQLSIASGATNLLTANITDERVLVSGIVPNAAYSPAFLDSSGAFAPLASHLADTSDAHDASAISYVGGTGMSATDVEAAIDELATEKANAATAVQVAEGSYTGDDTINRDIPLSFTPKFVVVQSDTGYPLAFSPVGSGTYGARLSASNTFGSESTNANRPLPVTNGFRVSKNAGSLNVPATVYRYFAIG